MNKPQMKKYRMLLICLLVFIFLIILKIVWVDCATSGHGTIEGERKEVERRMNYLIKKVVTTPEDLLDEMPSGIGIQYQGEWALYTCSMTAAALVNMTLLYPEYKERSVENIAKIIEIALSPEIRKYDRIRWAEDPLDFYSDTKSHISYLSHLAWMIGGFKEVGGDDRYDDLYHELCETMNRRILQSRNLNLPTYPDECIYVPDMLVAIVALANYSRLHHGEYEDVVKQWLEMAKTKWMDQQTGLLVSCLPNDELDQDEDFPVKGSYSALNCYYLTFIDPALAQEQYEKLKCSFLKRSPFLGIKEYCNRSCWFGMDIDAGPIIMNLSPSATAFALGSATYFHDKEVRTGILRTAEIAGSTVRWFDTNHYLLANYALIGEAIMLAMRTAVPWEAGTTMRGE